MANFAIFLFKMYLDIIWVCGDVSEVAMIVDNPLPAEIKVNNMVSIMDWKPVTFNLFLWW